MFNDKLVDSLKKYFFGSFILLLFHHSFIITPSYESFDYYVSIVKKKKYINVGRNQIYAEEKVG